MSKNKKILITRIVLIILIILWAILVFGMSNQQGEASSGLSRKITALFFKTEEQIALVEPYVRKIAHFSEYAIGGILFLSLFLTYEWSDKRRIITSILLGIWYAIFDEIHQLFVPERSGNIIDVLIDSLGICFGVCFMMLVYKIFKKHQKKKEGI